jgi:hypothetical protein
MKLTSRCEVATVAAAQQGAERHATAHVTTLGSMLRATSQKAGHAAPH